jgi:hypothetical protein
MRFEHESQEILDSNQVTELVVIGAMSICVLMLLFVLLLILVIR